MNYSAFLELLLKTKIKRQVKISVKLKHLLFIVIIFESSRINPGDGFLRNFTVAFLLSLVTAGGSERAKFYNFNVGAYVRLSITDSSYLLH